VRDRRRSNNSRDLTKTNERIRFPEIRVIDSEGEQLGIITPKEALARAQEQGLDLVLVSETAKPPVCKIMDYGKYKYEQDKKLKEAKKKQHNADVKEVKMRYKIEEHDYNVRVKNAQRFLKSGDKVKEDYAEVQQFPKREGRNMMMLLSPKK